jgi:hypothetical protein
MTLIDAVAPLTADLRALAEHVKDNGENNGWSGDHPWTLAADIQRDIGRAVLRNAPNKLAAWDAICADISLADWETKHFIVEDPADFHALLCDLADRADKLAKAKS